MGTILSANLSAVPVAILLRAGRIWCSPQCQNINVATKNLVSHTLELGLTPSSLPAKFGVTYTMGNSDPCNTSLPRILSAAAALLSNFQNDGREFTGLGRLKLVDMFIKHTHPLWWFNNAITLTLWALAPGQTVLDLQVIRLDIVACKFRQNAMPCLP